MASFSSLVWHFPCFLVNYWYLVICRMFRDKIYWHVTNIFYMCFVLFTAGAFHFPLNSGHWLNYCDSQKTSMFPWNPRELLKTSPLILIHLYMEAPLTTVDGEVSKHTPTKSCHYFSLLKSDTNVTYLERFPEKHENLPH